MPHESQAITRVHSCLSDKDCQAVKLQLMFNNGLPDAYYSGRHTQLWIEYKRLPKIPARDSTIIRPDLSSLQLRWFKTQHRYGCVNQWVVVYFDKERHYQILKTPALWELGFTRDLLPSPAVTSRQMAQAIFDFVDQGIEPAHAR